MKKLLVITLLFTASSIFAQKSIDTVKDTDELTMNVKKLNQTYVENDFSLWDQLFADDAIVYINNSKIDK
jgi:hypothetical protein